MQKKNLKTEPAKPNVPQAKLGFPNSGVQSLFLEHRFDPILDNDFHVDKFNSKILQLKCCIPLK